MLEWKEEEAVEEVKVLARKIPGRNWIGRTRTEPNTSSQVNVERVTESPDEDTAKCEVGWVGGWDFVLKQRMYARATGTVG